MDAVDTNASGDFAISQYAIIETVAEKILNSKDIIKVKLITFFNFIWEITDGSQTKRVAVGNFFPGVNPSFSDNPFIIPFFRHLTLNGYHVIHANSL